MVPEELSYSEQHEWVARSETGTVRVGITDFAQAQLGDVVFVQLPDAGSRFSAGEPFGEVESVKAVSELYAPVAGEVVGQNAAVVQDPELINTDPYGEGWMVEIRPADPASLNSLLSADEYRELIKET